jgi:hypothetical protein
MAEEEDEDKQPFCFKAHGVEETRRGKEEAE